MFSGVTSTGIVRASRGSCSSPNSTLNSRTLIRALPVTFAAKSAFFFRRTASALSDSTARFLASDHALAAIPSLRARRT